MSNAPPTVDGSPEEPNESPTTSPGSPPHSSDAEIACVRHKSLWFVDGSVILQAEQTLFRVHMSQLSRHSSFFRDLFSLPQPPHIAQETGSQHQGASQFPTTDQRYLDGCPLLELQDSAEDFTHLLAALYDGPTFGNNDREDYRVVSGILRLATKYLIDKLRARALEHLSVAWPSTLKKWDAREEVARNFEVETGLPRQLRYPSPIDVITLADLVSAPTLLQSAFYSLSRYNFSQIFESEPDVTLQCLSPTTRLSTYDTTRLAIGKEASLHAVTALIQSMKTQSQRSFPAFDSSSRSGMLRIAGGVTGHGRRLSGQICISSAACRKDFEELVELATQHYLFDREKGCNDPLYVAEELGQLKSAEFSECKACARSLELWASKERDKMWKLIPSWFRI